MPSLIEKFFPKFTCKEEKASSTINSLVLFEGDGVVIENSIFTDKLGKKIHI